MSTELATGYGALAPEARERWSEEQIATIRNTVAKDLTIAEFQMGMALAGKYGLDPLAHEIWFTKGKGRDGSPGNVMIMTGRDGYLSIARRTPEYKGMDCDVVREKDEFTVSRKPNGEREVTHSYSGSGSARGQIVGAWAIVYFEGKVPFYYYAELSEFKPRNENQVKYSPWGTQESTMILKCAQSYALRIASGISGITPADEVPAYLEDSQESTGVDLPSLGWIHEMVLSDPDLVKRLNEALETAGPNAPSHAVVEMSVRGQPRDVIERYIAWVGGEEAQEPLGGAEVK